MSPDGMQFLKPVELQIPYTVALGDQKRELMVLKNDVKHSKWKEVPLHGEF